MAKELEEAVVVQVETPVEEVETKPCVKLLVYSPAPKMDLQGKTSNMCLILSSKIWKNVWLVPNDPTKPRKRSFKRLGLGAQNCFLEKNKQCAQPIQAFRLCWCVKNVDKCR